jgi:hypothetical protein
MDASGGEGGKVLRRRREGKPIGDCRLQNADSRIDDCRLPIWIADCRFGLPTADLDCRLTIALPIDDCTAD